MNVGDECENSEAELITHLRLLGDKVRRCDGNKEKLQIVT